MRTRIPHLPQLIRSAAPAADLVPDRALLAEFVTSKSGIAFELLVRRHGPTVWAVCRRYLANTHDAEDAFQATFLVLAKSAARIAKHASVGGWLYGVAYRVALKARRSAARRKRVETAVAPTEEPTTLPAFSANDTTAIIHAELEKLPDRYRLPVLLCDLEGLSRKEASAQLGWSEGTLSGRLNRARKLLAGRLTVRGVAAGVLAAVGTAVTPPALATTTAAVGVGLSVIGTTRTAAPDTVSALTRGVMRDMTRSIVLKTAGVVLAASVLLGGGLFGLRFDTPPEVAAAPVPRGDERPKPDAVPDRAGELLVIPAVQRELKLSPEQRVGLIDGLDRLEVEMAKVTRKRTLEAVEGGQPVEPVVPPEVAKIQKEWKELIASILTKDQLARLLECEVQVQGPNALLLKRVADALNLTNDQQRRVKDIAWARPDDLEGAQIPRNGPHRTEFFMNKSSQADNAFAQLVQGFSKEQQKVWKRLTGEKVGFDLEWVWKRYPLTPGDYIAAVPVEGGGQAPGGEVLDATTTTTVPGGGPVPPQNNPLPKAKTPLAPPPAQLPPPAAPVKK